MEMTIADYQLKIKELEQIISEQKKIIIDYEDYMKSISNQTVVILVPEEYQILNGMSGMKRDIILKLLNKIDSDDKVRAVFILFLFLQNDLFFILILIKKIIGISDEFYNWKSCIHFPFTRYGSLII
jgi:hypothetical protein